MLNLKKLAIVGSGDLGQLIAYYAAETKRYEVVGFFDDYQPVGSSINGFPILGNTESVENLFDAKRFDVLMVGIGYKHFSQRSRLFDKFQNRIPFATIIHSSANISDSCTVKEGAIILPGCILDRNVVIEENVLINTGCVIAHDSFIGKHSFLSPAVAIAGFVKIGTCCNIGINTTVIDNINICDRVRTGGGTVVIKSIDQAGLYVGCPAKFIK